MWTLVHVIQCYYFSILAVVLVYNGNFTVLVMITVCFLRAIGYAHPDSKAFRQSELLDYIALSSLFRSRILIEWREPGT